MHSTRRIFIFQATTACLPCPAVAQTTSPVDEASETAVALGYRHDTTKVDAAKYPKHQSSQTCANCQFWQAKPGDAWSNCSMPANRRSPSRPTSCITCWRRPFDTRHSNTALGSAAALSPACSTAP